MEQTCTDDSTGAGSGVNEHACAETVAVWPRLGARERGRNCWKISGLPPRHVWRRTLTWCWLGILTSLAATLPAADQPPHPPALQVREAAPTTIITYRDGRLSVSAHTATWKEVLSLLERHTGIHIRVDGRLAGTLTQEFEALTLEQGLRRLFRAANVLMFYSRGMEPGIGGERLVQMWLVPKEDDTSEGMQVRASPSGLTAAGRHVAAKPVGKAVEGVLRPGEVTANGDGTVGEQDSSERLRGLEALAREGNTAALQQGLLDPDEAVRTQALELLAQREGQGATDVLVGLTRSAEAEMRLQALSLLSEVGQVDETTVLSALRTAVTDGDADVQRYAIEALAAQGSPDAMESLRQALRDPDPAIRALVIGSVEADGQGLPLLQEALADAEEGVRTLAAFRLQQEGSERR